MIIIIIIFFVFCFHWIVVPWLVYISVSRFGIPHWCCILYFIFLILCFFSCSTVIMILSWSLQNHFHYEKSHMNVKVISNFIDQSCGLLMAERQRDNFLSCLFFCSSSNFSISKSNLFHDIKMNFRNTDVYR